MCPLPVDSGTDGADAKLRLSLIYIRRNFLPDIAFPDLRKQSVAFKATSEGAGGRIDGKALDNLPELVPEIVSLHKEMVVTRPLRLTSSVSLVRISRPLLAASSTSSRSPIDGKYSTSHPKTRIQRASFPSMASAMNLVSIPPPYIIIFHSSGGSIYISPVQHSVPPGVLVKGIFEGIKLQ